MSVTAAQHEQQWQGAPATADRSGMQLLGHRATSKVSRRRANWAMRDPDLACLHSDPEFQRLRGAAWLDSQLGGYDI